MNKIIFPNQSRRLLGLLGKLLLAVQLVSCGNQDSFEACSDDRPLTEMDFNKPTAVEVPFYISSTMLTYPDATRLDMFGKNRKFCTPHAFKELINKVLQLYDSVETFNIVHKYAGTYDDAIPMSEPGVLYVSLNAAQILPEGVAGFGGPSGSWGAPGTIFNSTDTMPTTYPGGNLFLDTYPNLRTIIHEIGHTLGLSHIPSSTSVMSYEGRQAEGWNDGWYYKLTEQDRASLTATFPTPGAKYYTIKGSVKADLECNDFCQSAGGPVMVHAVNTVNGKAYSIQGRPTATAGVFSYIVNMLDPGTYKLVTLLPTRGSPMDPSLRESSWYIDNNSSSNDPALATAITVDDSTPTVSDIDLVLSEEPGPGTFDVMETGAPASSGGSDPWRESASSSDPLPMYLSPGESTRYRADLAYGCQTWEPARAHCEPVDSIQIFGSDPDVTISEFSQVTSPIGDDPQYLKFRITAAANAVPGDRLVIAQAGGKYIVGLIGISILNNATKPYYLDMSMKDIQMGRFDAANILDPNYWK